MCAYDRCLQYQNRTTSQTEKWSIFYHNAVMQKRHFRNLSLLWCSGIRGQNHFWWEKTQRGAGKCVQSKLGVERGDGAGVGWLGCSLIDSPDMKMEGVWVVLTREKMCSPRSGQILMDIAPSWRHAKQTQLWPRASLLSICHLHVIHLRGKKYYVDCILSRRGNALLLSGPATFDVFWQKSSFILSPGPCLC